MIESGKKQTESKLQKERGSMAGLKSILREEKKRLEELMEKSICQMKNLPEGTLRVSVDKGYPRYYRCQEGDKVGNYIRKQDKEIAQKLAQKEYNSKVLQLIQKRLKQIENIIKDYEDDEIEKCFYGEHAAKQKLIVPVEQTWQDKLKDWQEKGYVGKGFQDNTMEIYTQRGERVRSKSEKILADYFYYHGIPYKYECPLLLRGYGVIYPDFTFLSPKSRQEMYWEHNGMMDDAVYAQKAVKKIELYEKNGIFPGERLILTFETGQTTLNNEIIEAMAKRYLI